MINIGKNNFETLIKTGDGENLEKILKEKLNYSEIVKVMDYKV